MKKFLLLFTALLGLGLNSQADPTVVTTESPAVSVPTTVRTQWDASAILVDDSGSKSLPSGTLTVTASEGSEIFITTEEGDVDSETQATATADQTTGVAEIDLSDLSTLTVDNALYVIGNDITSVVYQSIPVAVEVTEDNYYVYFDDVEKLWQTTVSGQDETTTFVTDNVTFEVTVDAQWSSQVYDDVDGWGSTAQIDGLGTFQTNTDGSHTQTFTGVQLLAALPGLASATEVLIQAYSGCKILSATYQLEGSEDAVELAIQKDLNTVDLSAVLGYPDEKLNITISEIISTSWPHLTLTDNSDNVYYSWIQGVEDKSLNELIADYTNWQNSSYSNLTSAFDEGVTFTSLTFDASLPSDATIEISYGTNITLNPDEVVTPLDGTATFTEEAIAALQSEGTKDLEPSVDDNNIATTGTVETTFTLTVTPLEGDDNKVMLYANEADEEGGVELEEGENNWSFTAADIIALLTNEPEPESVRPLDNEPEPDEEEFVLTSLTITGISACSYTVTTTTTTTAYAPADVTYALDMDALYTYMSAEAGDGGSARVDQTSQVTGTDGKTNDFTWDTDKDPQLQLDEEDLEASSNEWLTIDEDATLQFRVCSGTNIVQLNGAVSFTMEKAGTVTVELASTGGSNWSTFALSTTENETTTYIEATSVTNTSESNIKTGPTGTGDASGLTLVAGQYGTYTSSNHTTAVWNVDAGEYTFATAVGSGANRAARIYALEVVELGAGWAETTSYEFTAEDLLALGDAVVEDDDQNITTYSDFLLTFTPAGTYGAKLTVTVAGEEGEEDTEIEVYANEEDEEGETILLTELDAEAILALVNGEEGQYTLENILAITVSDVFSVETSYNVATATDYSGYLNATLAGEPVGDANQEVTVTVTTNEVTGEVTMSLGSISIEGISLTNVAVTFTPDANGAFENGAVSGKALGLVSIDATAEGSYVIDENGDVTFSAEFEYMNMTIGVSFTTIEPTTEAGEEEWVVIATEEDFVTDESKWVGATNNQITLKFADLVDYEYIKIVGTTKTTADNETDSQDYSTWNDWGAIQTNTNWGLFGSKFAYESTTADQEPIIASIAEIQAACGTDATEFYIALWGNTISVTVYASLKAESTTEGPQWKVASQSWDGSWGGSWTGVSSATGVLELETTVGAIMAADGVEELGGINFQIWNVNGYEGTEIAWTFTVTTVDGTVVLEDSGTGIIGEEGYEVNEYNAISVKEYNTTLCGGTYSFNTTDIVKATVTVIGDIVYNAVADVKSDVEVVEVARYNLMGQKIAGAQKGINIILYSDGSSKKVLVK